MISLVVPLFVSSFMRSEDLADAMECRGYDPKEERTKYRKMAFSSRDLLAFLIVTCFAAAFITISATSFDAYIFFFGVIVK